MAKDFSKAFYNSKLWKDTREYILKRDDYVCVRCGRVAQEVHHIIRLSADNVDDKTVCVNPDNLISLCRECHQKEHFNERNHLDKCIFDENGMLVDVNNSKGAPGHCG